MAPYGTIPQTGPWDINREHPTFISNESAEFTFWMHDHRAGTNGAVPCNVVLETRFYGDDTRDSEHQNGGRHAGWGFSSGRCVVEVIRDPGSLYRLVRMKFR